MTLETFLSLAGLALAASFSPGPNNSMLASSGATFGLRATLPHMLGISTGFPTMIFLVAVGLGQVFANNSALQEVMRWAGAALLIYVAWRIATTDVTGSNNVNRKPFNFLQAAAFQWVNPKSWALAIAITAQFVTDKDTLITAATIAAVFVFCGLTSTLTWAWLGQKIGTLLGTPGKLRAFNILMAVMILGFLAVILKEVPDGV